MGGSHSASGQRSGAGLWTEPRGDFCMEIRGAAAVQRMIPEGGEEGPLVWRETRGPGRRRSPPQPRRVPGAQEPGGPEVTAAEPSLKISTPTSPRRPRTPPGSRPCGPQLCAEVPSPTVHAHGAPGVFGVDRTPNTQHHVASAELGAGGRWEQKHALCGNHCGRSERPT